MLDSSNVQQPVKEAMIISVRQSLTLFYKLDYTLSNHKEIKLTPQDFMLYLVLFNTFLNDLRILLNQRDSKGLETMFFLQNKKSPTFINIKFDTNDCAQTFNWTAYEQNTISRLWKISRKNWVDVSEYFVQNISDFIDKTNNRLLQNNTDIWYVRSNNI